MAVLSSWAEQLPELRGPQRGLRVTATKNHKAPGPRGRSCKFTGTEAPPALTPAWGPHQRPVLIITPVRKRFCLFALLYLLVYFVCFNLVSHNTFGGLWGKDYVQRKAKENLGLQWGARNTHPTSITSWSLEKRRKLALIKHPLKIVS